MYLKKLITITLTVVAIFLTISPLSKSCSVCLCGDDLYLYGHRHKLEAGRFSLSAESRFFSKSSGPAEPSADPDEREKAREYRPTLTFAYGASGEITLAANISSSFKRIEEIADGASDVMTNSGFGDMQFEAMWNRRISENPFDSYILGVLVSVQAPTGSNDKMKDGARIDEHIQAGTGAWGLKGGMGLSRITSKTSLFASAFYQTNGTNDFEYHYGNFGLFNLGGEIHSTEKFAITGDLNGRYAARDEEDGELLPNTGGWVFYLSPGFRYNVVPTLGFVGSIQIPIIEDLNEDQDENPVFNLSIRYDLL